MPFAQSLCSLALALCGTMPVGFHEFAVFGDARFFVSHYAAFSSIHAYQVIAEVRLSAADHDAAQRLRDDMAAHPGVHYTLSPKDDWVLPETVQAGNTFDAVIHYRANGKDVTVDDGVRAQVTQVIVKSLLDPKLPQPTTLRYVAFGDGYLAHELSAPPKPSAQKPDFDQILAVHLDGGAVPDGTVLTVDGRANLAAQALKKGDETSLKTPDGRTLHATVDGEVLSLSVPTER